MVMNASGVELISFDPAQSPTSPHNLTWAEARGYKYNEDDAMYRDGNGKLVEEGTHEQSVPSFSRRASGGTFW